MNLGKNAKYLRLKLGLLQKDVAMYLELNKTTYRQYENGKRKFPIYLMFLLFRLYGVKEIDLFSDQIETITPILDPNFNKIVEQNKKSLRKIMNNKKLEEHIKKNIAYNLKRLRIINHKTQLQVAKVLNISEGNYSRYESGQVNIEQSKLEKLSTLYSVTIQELCENLVEGEINEFGRKNKTIS